MALLNDAKKWATSALHLLGDSGRSGSGAESAIVARPQSDIAEDFDTRVSVATLLTSAVLVLGVYGLIPDPAQDSRLIAVLFGTAAALKGWDWYYSKKQRLAEALNHRVLKAAANRPLSKALECEGILVSSLHTLAKMD
jgi:hypothetical protein